ncbi:MAG: AraC family transcriptional regulator [Candidatus Merdivicinus sp.]|jgi:AraC-like DNA-binding protein
MKSTVQPFSTRQKMLETDYEIYRYRDSYLSEVELHHHDFYEIYFFVSGNVQYTIESRQYDLKPGDILLISPLELHQPMIQAENEAYERIVLWVSRGCLAGLSSPESDLASCFDLNSPQHTNLLRLDAVTVRRLQDMADALIEEGNRRYFGWELNTRALLTRIMVELNRRMQESPTGFEVPDESSGIISDVLRYINENFNNDISLDSLSEQFFVSKYHLSREFKRLVGTSVYRYIIQKRLIMAKQKMLAGFSPTIVYCNCGFGDYANFYRAFRAEYGISPKEFCEEAAKRGIREENSK